MTLAHLKNVVRFLVVVSPVIVCGCSGAKPVGALRLAPKAQTISIERLRESIALESGEQTAQAMIGMFKQGRLSVIATSHDIPARSQTVNDEVVVVLEGEGVAVVNGVRDHVKAGDVIVLPRKATLEFQVRGDKTVKLLSIVMLRKDAPDMPPE